MGVPIEAITTAALSAALETAGKRQAVVAANIANASTPGYVPQEVSFEAHVAEARRMLRDKGVLDLATVETLRGEPEPVFDAGGQPAAVQLDAQMSAMARNGVEFQALLQGLSRHLALLALAAGDGRR